ncbi:hypothetical protein J3Q64DRAFT_1046566 [Phycomyces blakesleeanus]|uniref:Uncharacterized protein n=1 Tax=Phycomyces blakesleeanus TaxID=4837 RepID=A0ABR3BDZ9_PHYBL
MYRELGLLAVLFLPVLLVYFYRSQVSTTDSDSSAKKSKKKNKSKKKKNVEPTAATVDSELDLKSSVKDAQKINDNKNSNQKPKQSPKAKDKSKDKAKDKAKAKANNQNHDQDQDVQIPSTIPVPEPTTPTTRPAVEENSVGIKKTRELEVDEHMDHTPRFARVLRIKTEEEEAFAPVPLEDGWSRQSVRPRTSGSSSSSTPEPLTKKQRENMARAAKRKEEKESHEALQAERLRRHQQQLDREKINSFYSSGAGKNTPWGKNGKRASAKVPASSASLNEHGQLIWD